MLPINIKKNPRTVELHTPYQKRLSETEIPFSEYPRPQFRRDSYLCLNGKWDFAVISSGKTEQLGKILVPFAPESCISGIKRLTGKEDRLVYTRSFRLPEGFLRDRVILHFGAVDQQSWVYVNNTLVGENLGGYLPFSFDITDFLVKGENVLQVEVIDTLDTELPYGKQRENRGGMWYTKISGIWQTVWMESVPAEYLHSLRITPSLHGVTLQVEGGVPQKSLYVKTPHGEFCYTFNGDTFELQVEDPILWTPENPYLYEFTITCGSDEIRSYFALRTMSVEQRQDRAVLCLNGEPYFFHGLLDQGYFSDGIYLPAHPDGFKDDILKMKACGFNMLRKHIKIEPELFYYYCDRYGMVVFQDMMNTGKYNFLIDTALPNVFLRRGVTHRVSKRRKEAFYRTADGMLELLYNHPCVCYYTIFNEGWGQFRADENYTRFKALDPTRIYDTTSGWFKETLSDVDSEHVYFRPLRLRVSPEKPMVLSEFGGYSYKVVGHLFNLDCNYGCTVKTEDGEIFRTALTALYEQQVLPAIRDGLCAAVYTQLSDVEDETNGLLTYDRQILKVNADRMKLTANKLFQAFSQTNRA